MNDTRIHSCGRPMFATPFGHHDPTPQYRSQPLWACAGPCQAWEPRQGWQGDLPDGWDGEKWTEENA